MARPASTYRSARRNAAKENRVASRRKIGKYRKGDKPLDKISI